MKLSQRQREVLRIMVEYKPDGWGELWTLYSGEGALDFSNFNRVGRSLVRMGLIRDGDEGLSLTDAGAVMAREEVSAE